MAALTTPTANSVIPSSAGVVIVGTAGGTITIGKPVYLSAASTIIEANADSTGSVTAATVIGIALNSCVTGQKVMYCVADASFAHGFTASETAPGDLVMLNDTAGTFTITPADLDAADWVCYIGQINNPETTMNLAPKTPILKA
tara:strand:- start:190 stop:621 length:432 start_codon:yes stop_codon:yes gene_type:complete